MIKITFFGFTGAGRGPSQIRRNGRGHRESLTTRERAGWGAEWTGRGGSGICFEKLFTGRGEAGWRVLRGGPRGTSTFHAPHISGDYRVAKNIFPGGYRNHFQ